MVESIGNLFSKVRKHRKISLEKVSQETKIKKEYLSALENENFNELPGEIYVRAFLIKYAQYLGINTGKILSLYKEKRPLPEKKQLRLRYSNLSSRSHRKSWVGLLTLLLIITVIIFKLNQLRKVPPPVPKVEEVAPKVPTKALNLKIKAVKDCWLQIKEGDKVIFEDNLKKGEEKSWETDQEFVLKVDNAAGLELEYNKNFIGPVGGEGEFIPALVITPEEIYFDE